MGQARCILQMPTPAIDDDDQIAELQINYSFQHDVIYLWYEQNHHHESQPLVIFELTQHQT